MTDIINSPPQLAAILRPIDPPSTSTSTFSSTNNDDDEDEFTCTSLSFHSNGKHLFVSHRHGIRLYDVTKPDVSPGDDDGGPIQSIRYRSVLEDSSSEKQHRKSSASDVIGIRDMKATHANYCCLVAPAVYSYSGVGPRNNKEGDGKEKSLPVEYISLYDNKVLRTFDAGHAVRSIGTSPLDDSFLTSACRNSDGDGTVKLWDVKSPACCAKIVNYKNVDGGSSSSSSSLPSSPIACFDGTGLVYGVAMQSGDGSCHNVHLYDARKYSVGPFAEFKLMRSSVRESLSSKNGFSSESAEMMSLTATWNNMQFSADGKDILISCDHGIALTMDGYTGLLKHVYVREDVLPSEAENIPAAVACYTPDDKSILIGGSNDGVVRCYDSQGEGTLQFELSGGHVGRVSRIACSPRISVIATGSIYTGLWISPPPPV